MMHFSTLGGPYAPQRARRALEAMAGDLKGHVLDDVVLLTSELVSNCVKHGDARQESEIQVAYSTPDSVVRVEVTGPGKGFELEMPAADPTAPGGFGLRIVETVASRWGLSDGGRSAWFEVPREHDNGQAPSGTADEALAWADTCAGVADFPAALAWLERAERIMGQALPDAYASKRARWALVAADAKRP